VTARGKAQAPIYENDADRRRFTDVPGDARSERRWRLCHGNNYHLVVETPLANRCRGVRDLNGMYTRALQPPRRRSDTTVLVFRSAMYPGHVPGGGVGAVGRWPAEATATSLA
jgi:hypothetical protein